MENKIKYILVILPFVGYIAFISGNLSNIFQNREGIKVVKRPENEHILYADILDKKAKNSDSGSILASRSGTKYYLAGCSGAGRIKAENKVFFESEEAAKQAGYDKAKNC